MVKKRFFFKQRFSRGARKMIHLITTSDQGPSVPPPPFFQMFQHCMPIVKVTDLEKTSLNCLLQKTDGANHS